MAVNPVTRRVKTIFIRIVVDMENLDGVLRLKTDVTFPPSTSGLFALPPMLHNITGGEDVRTYKLFGEKQVFFFEPGITETVLMTEEEVKNFLSL